MDSRGGWSVGVGVARKLRKVREMCEEESVVIVLGGEEKKMEMGFVG